MGQVIFSKTGTVTGAGSSTRTVRITTTDTFDQITGKYIVALSKVEFRDSVHNYGSRPFYGRVFINETLVYHWTGSSGNVNVSANTFGTVSHTGTYGSVQADNGSTVTIRIASSTSAWTSAGMGIAQSVSGTNRFFGVDPGSDSFDLPYVALGAAHIDNGSSFDTYEIYIDNGTGWDKYAPYIDNGNSWDIYN